VLWRVTKPQYFELFRRRRIMRKKLVLLISVLVLSLACTSHAVVIGDFEDGLDGWAPSGDNTLTQSTIGATTGTGSALIEGPGSWQMLALLDIKSLRSVIAVEGAAISADVTAFAEDMVTDWMNMEMIINGQNTDDNGANNNIGWQSLGGLDIVRDGVSQTLTWEIPADLSAKIAGVDDNIAWFELFIVTNNGAANTKIYIDNIQLIGAEPEPEPTGPKIAWVSYHAADDEPHADAAAVGFTQAPDIGYTDLLKANGYDVTRVLTSQTPDVEYLNTFDLVIISRTASSGHYGGSGATAWNSVTAPMINLNGYTLRNSRLGFTDGADMPDTTGDVRLAVTDPTHPIFAGITLTDGVMDNSYAAGAVPLPTDGTLSRGISINNNNLDEEGTVLAAIAEVSADTGPVGGMVIAELPAGATLQNSSGSPTDMLGGPRLVFLTGSREPDGVTGGQAAALYDLYPDGEKMFLNAVKYMLEIPKIIFVSFHGADDVPSAGAIGAGFTEAPDKGYTDLLKANGYIVKRYITTGNPDPEVLNAADLVIISRSVASTGYQNDGATAWNSTITAPMIIMQGWALRSSRMGYTTGTTMVDITGDVTLTVSDPNHPIFAGIPLTDSTMDNPYAGIVVYPTDGTTVALGVSINTDPVDDEGVVLATISEAGNGPVGGMVIGEWQAGATLTHSGGAGTDILAGHRLVFMSGSRENGGISSETAGMYDLHPDGAQIFLNAVEYMIPVIKSGDPGTEGLVAHYAFENDLADSSGNGLDGTAVGDPTFAAGVAGMALDLNGDDYVDCGGVAEFSFADAMTVSTWVNIRSHTAAWMAMVAKGENAWRLGFNNTTTGVHYAFSGGGRGWQAANTATELAFDEWYHVAATYDTKVGAQVYIDGVVDATNPDLGGIDINQFSVLIGENPEATGRLFDGMLDEIMIYNRALSEEEVLFLAGK
jgi:hypothetical protein